jgi:autotransporter-associated beta strand protein
VTANAALTVLNPIDLTGSNRFFQVNGTNASIAPVIAGVIRGSGVAGQSALTKQGVGMLVLAATNTYDGPTYLNAGTLSVGYLADGGLGSGIGASPANLTNLVFTGGRLLYTGIDATSDRGFQIGANGGWINVAGNTLTLGGTFSNSAANAFTKIGNGTLRLTGDGRLVNGVNAYGGSLVFTGTNTFGAMNVETNANLTFGENSFARAGVLTVKTGSVLLTNGTVFVGNSAANIGNAAGDFGTMTVAGTAVWSSTNMPVNVAGPVMSVGNAGKGVLIVQDNAILTNRLYVGNSATGAGAVYQRGGTVEQWGGQASDGRIGMGGYGYYGLEAGSLTFGGFSQLGHGLAAIGVLDNLGGSFLQTNKLNGQLGISRGGIGVFNQVGGSFRSSVGVNLGEGSENGLANGIAVFNMLGGDATIVGNMNMALRTNMTAILNINGGTLTLSQISRGNVAGSLSLVNFDGGTLQARQNGHLVNIGVNAPTAAYIHDGGATIDSQAFIVTNMQALLAAPGQGVNGIAMTPMGGFIGSPYVEITGGGGTGATAMALFDSHSGSVTGIVVTSPGYDYATVPAVTLRGGGSTNVLLGAATIAANTSGGLTKIGNGTLMLGASNTYTGTTRVMAGVLGLTGAGSVQQSATLQIDAGAKMVVTGLTATMHLVTGQTLQGNGTFEGGLITDSGSAVRPGSSADTLTMLGNLTADAGTTFTFELNGLTAGTQYDQILFGGSGAYSLTLNDANLDVQLNFVPGVGDSFQIFSGFGTLAGTTGEFSGRPDGSTFTVNSTEFQIDYQANDITLTVVPEPASFGLLSLLGMAGWLLRRRLRGQE